ncbi:Uncharacterized protein DBV15_10999, partial [Temnothorax longispinosus]
MLLDDGRRHRLTRDPTTAFFDIRLLFFIIVVYVTALRREISNATITRSDDRGFPRRTPSLAAKPVDRVTLGRHNSTVHLLLLTLVIIVKRLLLLLHQCHHTHALRAGGRHFDNTKFTIDLQPGAV